MMPVIRISDTTWERLKQWAEPLEDSPEDVIRKVLDLAEKHKEPQRPQFTKPIRTIVAKEFTRSGRLRSGLKAPMESYRLPILQSIYELGGSAPTDEVLKRVEDKMKNMFTDVDYQDNPSGGDTRWRNTAQWERLVLVKDGLLKSSSPRGIWELTEKGAKEIRRGKD